MDVQTVQKTIEQALAETGITDSFIEIVEAEEKQTTFFDIQRRNVNGEELWFCFRVAFEHATEEYTIITRENLDRDRSELFSLGRISKNFFQLWMQYYISDPAVLNELTRP